MIKVIYKYKRKSDGLWMLGEQTFDDCEKARRFMIKIDSPKSPSFVLRYECDDRDEQEYINQRYTMGRYFKL